MDKPIRETTDEARAGTTPNIVRYVLATSIALVIIVMLLVLIWGNGTFADHSESRNAASLREDRSGSLDTPDAAVTEGRVQPSGQQGQ